ncbi:MAG: uroporphyrinogen-III C-methyltransferase [Neisseriaceae bacterium]|nr:uroporphyrinogen-III C-methyltransferase [Neisseriaceae bacterium]MBP6861191.1 uroporphyrinogen-III C-methyltransferase [Neisseriaceae bacterium]
MAYFPIFTDLAHKPVLVVGGGTVAERKVAALLKSEALVQLVAPKLNQGIQAWLDAGQVSWLAASFSPEQIDGVWLVIAATDDQALNQQVFLAAEARHRWVNVVDDQALCGFITPAVIDRGPIQIAISSGGAAPVLARQWRERIEAILPQHIGRMASLAAAWRTRVKVRITEFNERRYFWERLFSGPFEQAVRQGQDDQAEALLAAQLDGHEPSGGEVILVGAGPGDAGLLTLKGLQAIQNADVVLYDALVGPDVLNLIRRDADKVAVGKRAGGHQVAQEETNQLLLDYALAGKKVVRLKGGDPFVFGRGGEELEALAQAGIPFEVVPGITAALGATAYAGIPLTHRDHAQTALFITGHCRPDGHELDWSTLARGRQTLVVYMGTIKAADISAALIQHGRGPDTPVAIISQGTLPTQSVRSGVLAELATLAQDAPTPALIVIGEVVALQRELAWFGR